MHGKYITWHNIHGRRCFAGVCVEPLLFANCHPYTIVKDGERIQTRSPTVVERVGNVGATFLLGSSCCLDLLSNLNEQDQKAYIPVCTGALHLFAHALHVAEDTESTKMFDENRSQLAAWLHHLHSLEREIINQQQQVVETRRQVGRLEAAVMDAESRPQAARATAAIARSTLNKHEHKCAQLANEVAKVLVSCSPCLCMLSSHQAIFTERKAETTPKQGAKLQLCTQTAFIMPNRTVHWKGHDFRARFWLLRPEFMRSHSSTSKQCNYSFVSLMFVPIDSLNVTA